MLKQLLVPLDHSALAEQAVGQAAAIARASGAAIDLVLVHQPIPLADLESRSWTADYRSFEYRYLASISAEIGGGAGIEVTHAVLSGPVTEMICQRARDVDADLIVMTSHGRTGLSRAWMGSVASSVVRHAGIPVLILRASEKQSRGDAARHLFRRVLVPLDGSAYAADILPAAAMLARCDGGHLSLLRIVQPVPAVIDLEGASPYGMAPMLVDEEATRGLVEIAEREVREVARSLEAQGIPAVDSTVVVAAGIGPAIIDHARGHQIDVIAMSTHGRGFSRLFMGSVADKVLRGSGLPVMLRRPLGVGNAIGTETESEIPAIADP